MGPQGRTGEDWWDPEKGDRQGSETGEGGPVGVGRPRRPVGPRRSVDGGQRVRRPEEGRPPRRGQWAPAVVERRREAREAPQGLVPRRPGVAERPREVVVGPPPRPRGRRQVVGPVGARGLPLDLPRPEVAGERARAERRAPGPRQDASAGPDPAEAAVARRRDTGGRTEGPTGPSVLEDGGVAPGPVNRPRPSRRGPDQARGSGATRWVPGGVQGPARPRAPLPPLGRPARDDVRGAGTTQPPDAPEGGPPARAPPPGSPFGMGRGGRRVALVVGQGGRGVLLGRPRVRPVVGLLGGRSGRGVRAPSRVVGGDRPGVEEEREVGVAPREV